MNLFLIGCGRGQLCLAAARARPWAACRGLEIIPEVLHIGRGAIDVLEPKALQTDVGGVELRLGDMYADETQALYTDSDVLFVYATCLAAEDGRTLRRLSESLAASLRPGSRVVVVNKNLDTALPFRHSATLLGPNPDSVNDVARACVYEFVG